MITHNNDQQDFLSLFFRVIHVKFLVKTKISFYSSFFVFFRVMKILFLCAGYGTRLERDLKNSSEFPECIGRPKGLLPVGEKALISYWFDSMKSMEEIPSEVIIVTNDKHQEQFHKSKKWYAPNFSQNLKIINDGSTSNETRLGAVSDIKFGLESKYDEDVLVVAGDTLFMDDFNLGDFIKRFNELKKVLFKNGVLH